MGKKKYKVVIYYGVDDRGRYQRREEVGGFDSYEVAEAYAEVQTFLKEDVGHNVMVYFEEDRG